MKQTFVIGKVKAPVKNKI